MHDVAAIIPAYRAERWLPACLETLLRHAGDVDLDVIVVDNDPGDEIAAIVADFPQARTVTVENRGFAAANNDGLKRAEARYALFLNPDTEFRRGTLAELVARLDERPEIGLAGVRQMTPSGELCPTARYTPSVPRALADALGADKLPAGVSLGQRMRDLARYEREFECDWTAGSFMLVRREALLGAGAFDERFFLYSEEADLALRIRQAGWQVWHMPQVEILHHELKSGVDPRLEAQQAFARRQYVRKHLSPPARVAFLVVLAIRYGLRGALASRAGANADAWRETARRTLPLLAGRGEPPFGPPPGVAVRIDAPPEATGRRRRLFRRPTEARPTETQRS